MSRDRGPSTIRLVSSATRAAGPTSAASSCRVLAQRRQTRRRAVLASSAAELGERRVQLIGQRPCHGRRGRQLVLEARLERERTVSEAAHARQDPGRPIGAELRAPDLRFEQRALNRGLGVRPRQPRAGAGGGDRVAAFAAVEP